METNASSPLQSLPTGHNDDLKVENLPLENENGTKSPNFVILDRLEAYRQPVDGKLELLLC